MKAFVVYPTYRIVDGRSFVHLYGRLENGKSFLAINEFRPYFWILRSDLKKATKLASFESQDSDFVNFQREKVVKILTKTPLEVPPLRQSFEDADIRCFEADVRFAYRFMMDQGILGSCDIKGTPKKGEGVDCVFEEPSFEPMEWFPSLKVLSIDIETDPKANVVYAISSFADDFSSTLIVSDKKLKRATSCKDEKEMLTRFRDEIQSYDPDLLVGWNFIDFDLAVLKRRFEHHGIPFVLGRTKEDVRLKIFADFFRESSADVTGRMVLDGIHMLKNSFVSLDDYRLDTAAKAFVGKGKLIEEKDRWDIIEKMYRDDPQRLVDYNVLDADLALKVLQKSGALDLTIQRSLLTGMPLNRVGASIASLDSLYLRELAERKTVAISTRFAERETDTKGGFVMASKPGIYDFILVEDFKSLYPSLIRTFNIDPLSYVGQDVKGKDVVTVANGASFRNDEGILPALIQRLWLQRDKAKKEKDQRASFAIKILMNSFYGVLANQNCRFFSSSLANAITHTGQELIKLTATKVNELGYEVIYGDTDSIFVRSAAKDAEDAQRIGLKIQDFVNEFYVEYIKEKYHRTSFMELQFEKVFHRFVMPYVRGSKVGAKKRYAGLIVKEGKEQVVFTGMEFVRSDWTPLAKDFQMELFDRVFHRKEVKEYVRKFVKDLLAGKFDDQLVYRKQIRKDLKEYTKTTPPHVKAARML
ncbi:MAG: DNA polymerase II, partial [Nanoarchaeota archaeon]